MKYHLRKRENVLSYLTSEVVELDEDAFRKLTINPYTGKTPEEFLNYINDIDMCDGAPEGLSEDQSEALQRLKGELLEMKEYGNSAEKFEDSWLELGQNDKQLSKTGGFQIEHSLLKTG